LYGPRPFTCTSTLKRVSTLRALTSSPLMSRFGSKTAGGNGGTFGGWLAGAGFGLLILGGSTPAATSRVAAETSSPNARIKAQRGVDKRSSPLAVSVPYPPRRFYHGLKVRCRTVRRRQGWQRSSARRIQLMRSRSLTLPRRHLCHFLDDVVADFMPLDVGQGIAACAGERLQQRQIPPRQALWGVFRPNAGVEQAERG